MMKWGILDYVAVHSHLALACLCDFPRVPMCVQLCPHATRLSTSSQHPLGVLIEESYCFQFVHGGGSPHVQPLQKSAKADLVHVPCQQSGICNQASAAELQDRCELYVQYHFS